MLVIMYIHQHQHQHPNKKSFTKDSGPQICCSMPRILQPTHILLVHFELTLHQVCYFKSYLFVLLSMVAAGSSMQCGWCQRYGTSRVEVCYFSLSSLPKRGDWGVPPGIKEARLARLTKQNLYLVRPPHKWWGRAMMGESPRIPLAQA